MKRLLLAAALLLCATPAVLAQTTPATPAAAPATPSVPVAPLAVVQTQVAQPGAVLLDVRTPAEFAAGHLPGAQNLDFRAPDFAQRAAQLDPKGTYVLYCASGNRSGKAAAHLQQQGFAQVVNAGAYQQLQEQKVGKAH